MGRKKGPNIGKALNSIFKTMGKMARAAAAAEKKRQREAIREENRRINTINRLAAQHEREMNRFYAQAERERVRRIKQEEMAEKRAAREQAKALRDEERERVKAAKLQAKLEKQQQIEDEIAEIESENNNWTNAHRLIDHIDLVEEVTTILEKCNTEQQDIDAENTMFDKPKPTKYDAENQAQAEARNIYDTWNAQIELKQAEERFRRFVDFNVPEPSTDISDFNVPEPTRGQAYAMLVKEAESKISTFFPWKQNRLRKEYVSERLNSFFDNIHDEWEKLKAEYENHKLQVHADWEKEKSEYEVLKTNANDELQAKRAQFEKKSKDQAEYIEQRTETILDKSIAKWKDERNDFYSQLRDNLQDNINGDKDFVITAVDDLFPNDDLEMEYFVDIAYDYESSKVFVDLDLPEIEDIPQQKIALTPSGEKSIRQKTQTDLRGDYVNCIFGLAMYVAYNIFNVSVKISEIEISGYTQRKGENSALATDQYVFLVDFTRGVFSEIDFQKFSSLEVMDFFKHHYNMTKTFDLKEIDLSTAYSKMESFTPAEYSEIN